VCSWSGLTFLILLPTTRSTEADQEAMEIGAEKTIELSRKLGEIYLRRDKATVLRDDLPQKDERIIFCEPSKLQKELYRHIIAQPDFVLLGTANAPCDCGVNRKVRGALCFFLALKYTVSAIVSRLFSFSFCFPVLSRIPTQTERGGTD